MSVLYSACFVFIRSSRTASSVESSVMVFSVMVISYRISKGSCLRDGNGEWALLQPIIPTPLQLKSISGCTSKRTARRLIRDGQSNPSPPWLMIEGRGSLPTNHTRSPGRAVPPGTGCTPFQRKTHTGLDVLIFEPFEPRPEVSPPLSLQHKLIGEVVAKESVR